MTERISIPATTATTHQLVHRILERVNDMVERLDRLNTAVEQELADDAAQNQLIAELREQLNLAREAADAAETGEAVALGQLQAALEAADNAAARLESNDPPRDDTEPEEPEQPEEPADPEPTEPETPGDDEPEPIDADAPPSPPTA